MKNSITIAQQFKSAVSARTVTSRSGKSSGTVSKSRKSALKKSLASYGAFNCILPALTILLIGIGRSTATAGFNDSDGFTGILADGDTYKVNVNQGLTDSGSVVVAGAVALNGEYETLADAFSAINSNSQSGANITVTIEGNTSEPPAGATLNANSWNSLTVVPSGARTVSGSTSYNTPLIHINGADNVLIDGLNSGGNSLTFSNNSAVIFYQGMTLCLINDASNNTITRCTLLGSGLAGLFYEPSVVYMGQGSVTGNDNNVISHCNISSAGGNLPTYAVRSLGSASDESMFNSGDTLRDCNIYDFFNAERNSAGISVSQGSTNFIIKNNKFYQTSARTAVTGSAVNKAVDIANTSGSGFLVSGNTVGFSDSAGTGNYEVAVTGGSAVVPIDVSAGTATVSEVSDNLIRSFIVTGTNLSNTSLFTAVRVTNGNVNVTGNEIGDSALTSSINLSGWSGNVSSAYIISLSGSGSCTASGNSIYGISYNRTNAAPITFVCISSSLGGSWTCLNNIIGSGLPNSISNNSTNVNTVTSGVYSSGGEAEISYNLIRNISTSGGTIYGSSPNPFTGISSTASGSQTISNNIIHTLTNSNPDVVSNGGASNLQGIFISNSAGNTVKKNLIHSLKINSNIGIISGIQLNSGSSELRNNMIRIGTDAAGNGVNNPCYHYGIYDVGGNNDLYFNSIYIGGNPVSGNNASTYGLYSTAANVRNYISNIFFNARSNNGSAGIHAAIRINNLTGFTSNYNVLYANGSGGITGYYNAQRSTIQNWRTATGQDANSKSANPNYINPAGNSSTVDLHISKALPTPVESNGTSIGSVTEDFDGQMRTSFSPDDMGADAGNFAQSDTSAMSISYTAIPPAANNSNVAFGGVTITDSNGVNVSPGTAPRVYYKKKSDPNELNDNTSSTAGWKYSEANNSSSPFNFTLLFSRLDSPVTQSDTILYFVVAQDLASFAHVGVSNAVFSEYPFSAALTSAAFPVSGSMNSFTFQNLNVSVSGAVAGNGMYANLYSAFAEMNSAAQTGSNILIQINGNTTEPSSGITLNENDWSTLSIVPSGGSAITVSGAITAGLPLIDLNGADRVKIDGLNTGGNSLTLINTTFSFTSGTSTINFRSDASDNVVTNCTILSSAAVHQSFDGGAVNFGTGTATGNNNNLISYCNISKHSAGPLTKAVAFLGSTLTSAYNKGDTIRNCNIYDYGYGPVQSGVAVLSGNTDIVIKDNRFYQTSTVSLNPDAQHSAVRIVSSLGTGFTISGNVIGYSSQSGTGKYTITGSNTARFNPVFLQAGSTAYSNIQGNIIAGITMSGAFNGVASNASFIAILLSSGAANVSGNTIGSQSSLQNISVTSSSASNTEVVGIHCGTGTTTNVSENNAGGLYGVSSSSGGVNLFGIKNTSTNDWICRNNTFGGSIANSMQTTSTSTSTIVIGIQNTGRSSLITGNTVRNFTAGGGTPGTYISSTMGILLNTSSATHTVANNLIHNLSNTNTTQPNNLTGIAVNAATVGILIENNFIHSISSSSLNATITGMLVNTGTATYRNNMISLGTGMNTGCIVAGIQETGGVNNYYFNSVYIAGNPGSGSLNTFALRSYVISNPRNFIGNILFNSRSNSGATAKHYSVSLAGTAPLPAGCYSNNNLLFSNGTGGVLGLYNGTDRTSLATWLSATGLDSNSVTGDPKFISAGNLHIDTSQASPASDAGRYIAGAITDFDGDTRNVSAPDIGADEFNSPDLSISLTLSVFFEGFYNSVADEQIADTVRVHVRSSSFPYAVIDSAISISDSAGIAEFQFDNVSTGNYFITVRHRNTIETWSSSAIALTAGSPASFSFSTAASQAYGSNLVQIDNSPVRFALYSGDANQDKTVDATDLSLIDNDAASYNSGYLQTDINGDGFADGTDFAMADNNASNFISAIEP
ncbi:MAG: hypothetical protein K1X85_03765 [Ignavibacteria bacterium]|nr:hypothetical protein [Ignavibacteria bacterium]